MKKKWNQKPNKPLSFNTKIHSRVGIRQSRRMIIWLTFRHPFSVGCKMQIYSRVDFLLDHFFLRHLVRKKACPESKANRLLNKLFVKAFSRINSSNSIHIYYLQLIDCICLWKFLFFRTFTDCLTLSPRFFCRIFLWREMIKRRRRERVLKVESGHA